MTTQDRISNRDKTTTTTKDRTTTSDRKAVVSKKKKKTCCSCLVKTLIVSVVILGLLTAAAWITGDYFTKQYFDMSLGDVFGVVGDLRRNVKEKDMDFKQFDAQGDLSGFESALLRQTYLKEDVKIPYSAMFEEAMKILSPEPGGLAAPMGGFYKPAIRDTLLMEAVRDRAFVSDGAEQAMDRNGALQLVAALLLRENMDAERLAKFPGEGADEKCALSDAQIAAFINALLTEGVRYLESGKAAGIDPVIADNVKQVSLKQVRISGAAESPVLRLTATANVRKIAADVVKEKAGLTGFLLNAASWGVSWAIPEKVYLSVDIGLGAEPTIALQYNNLSPQKMERIYRLVANVTKSFEIDEVNVPQVLDESANRYLTNELFSYIDCAEAANGKVSMDMFGIIIALTGINEGKAEKDRVTSKDFIYTLRFLTLSKDPAIPAVNAEGEYLKEIQSKFYLKDEPEDFKALMDVASADEFDYKNFNVTGTGALNGENKAQSLAYDTRSAEELKLFLRDADLIQIIREEILGENMPLDEGAMEIVALMSQAKGAKPDEFGIEVSDEGRILILIKIDLPGLLKGQLDFLSGLLPEALYLSIEFDISEDGTAADEDGEYSYYKAELELNQRDREDAEIQSILRLIRAFGGDAVSFDIDAIAREAGRTLYEFMNKIRDNVGEENIKFATSKNAKGEAEAGLQIGSFYHFLAATEKDGGLDAETLMKALRGMYAYDAGLEAVNPQYAAQNDNYKVGDVVFNPIAAATPVLSKDDGSPDISDPARITFTIEDKEFGAILVNGGWSVEGQTLVSLGANNPFAAEKYELAQFDSYSEDAFETAALTLTFKAGISLLTDFSAARDSGYYGLMPDEIYFTFEVQWDKNAGGNRFSFDDGLPLKINNLDNAQTEQFIRLTGYKLESLREQADKCLNAFNALPSGISFGQNLIAITASFAAP